MKTVSKDRAKLYRKLGVTLAGVGVCAFAFVLYVMTLAPTVLYYDRPILLDSAMYQVQAILLGITGVTGEPGWTMLTHLFTYLPFGDLAYRVNLASAVYATGTVLMVYVTGLLLTRRVAAAAVGALALGLSGTFWSQAVIAEVYTLNTLLILLPIISLLLWRERRDEPRSDRYLLLASFLGGLAMTNHMTSGLLIPMGFLFVAAVNWRKLVDWRLVLGGAGLFFLGLSPYAFLPIRASMDPPINEADPSTWKRFLEIIGGADQQGQLFEFGLTELPGRLALYGGHLFDDFHPVLVAFAVAGFATLLFRDRALALMLGAPYLGWLFHSLEFAVYDVELFFLPSFLMLTLMMTVGLGGLLEATESLLARFPSDARRAALAGVSAVLVVIPLIGLAQTFREEDMSEDYRGREIVEDVAENAAPNSTILHHRSTLWYMVLIEERRRDLTLVDPWFPGRTRYTDIVWPDDLGLVATNLRYATNDYTGVSTAFEVAEDGPVYILDQDSAALHNFYEADFRTVQVEGDLLELVPPGREPYSQPEKASSNPQDG